MKARLFLLGLIGSAVFVSGEEKPGPPMLKDWREKMAGIVPRHYVCGRAGEAVKIDGKLDDAVWAQAAWTEDFVDIEGAAKPKPRLRTRAKMLWDAEYFYVAAEIEEPHVWATLTKHDSVIFYDPDFEVFIDPNGDSHEYYEFEINALNTGWDLYLPKPYKDGGKAQDEWEIPGLRTAVHVNGTLNDPSDKDVGWTVEIAFPWKVLGEHAHRSAPPKEGDQWRVGFSRVEWAMETKDGKTAKVPNTPENNWIWSPQGVIDMHRPERWGFVQFTEKGAAFVDDPSREVRNRLQEVYYAQRDYQKAHGRWAASLEELGMAAAAADPSGAPKLTATADGYLCALDLGLPGGKRQRWTIRQDALIAPEKDAR